MAAGSSHHELKHIALGQAVGEITLTIGSYHFQLVTTCNQLIRNFYKAIIQRLDVKRFGLNTTSRIKGLSSVLSLLCTSKVDQDIKSHCVVRGYCRSQVGISVQIIC